MNKGQGDNLEILHLALTNYPHNPINYETLLNKLKGYKDTLDLIKDQKLNEEDTSSLEFILDKIGKYTDLKLKMMQ